MIALLVLAARMRGRLPRNLGRWCWVTFAAVVISVTPTLVQVSQAVAASPPSPTSEAPLTPPPAIGAVWTALWIPGPTGGTPGTLDIVANSAFSGTVTATIDGRSTSLSFRSGTAIVALTTGVAHVVAPPPGTILVAINSGPTAPLVPVISVPQLPPPVPSPTAAPTPAVSGSPLGSVSPPASAIASASASATAAPTATPTATAAPIPTPALTEPTLAPLDPGGPASTTDGQRQSLAQWLDGYVNDFHGVTENLSNILKDPSFSEPDAIVSAFAAHAMCGELPGDAAAVSKCLDKILGRTPSNPSAEAPTDLPTPTQEQATLTKVASDGSTIELQQQIEGKVAAGIESTVSADGSGLLVDQHAPLLLPKVVTYPSDVTFNGKPIPIIARCWTAGSDCVTASNGKCGSIFTVATCAESSGETLAQEPNGTTTDVAGANGAPGVTVDESPVVAPDGTAGVTNAEGLTSTTTEVSTIADTSETAAQSGILSKIATGLKWADRAGKVFGWAGMALGIVNFVADVGNGDYPAALHAGADTAWGGMLLFGGSAAIADAVTSVAVALLPEAALAAVPAAPAIIAIVAIVLVSWAVATILEAIFADLFAPDIYVDNATGRDVDVGVRLATQGTHDVRPAWSGGAGVWNATAHSDGTLTVGGAAVGQLHYQLLGPVPFQRSAGWVVPRTGFVQWARAVLPRYGFDAQAVAGFISSWAELADGGGSIDIYPQTGALLDRLEPLAVTSSAGVPSVRRVWFVISPAVTGPQPAPPQVVDLPHAAIDVEEWGILLDRGADPVGGLQS
jgi:hypothetical protein